MFLGEACQILAKIANKGGEDAKTGTDTNPGLKEGPPVRQSGSMPPTLPPRHAPEVPAPRALSAAPVLSWLSTSDKAFSSYAIGTAQGRALPHSGSLVPEHCR